MILQKKFSKIFKISVSSGFNRSSLFFNRSKREEENSVFNLKSRACLIPSQFLLINRAYFHVHFDSFLIPLDRLVFIFFFKTYRNQIRLFKLFFVFLSGSSLDPFLPPPPKKIVVFLGKDSKVFFKNLR